MTEELRRVVRWLWIAVAVAALYTGSVFVKRWRERRAAEQEAVRQEAKASQEIVDRYGGSELKILMFYANPAVIPRGGKGLLCYGVANAETARIEPGVEDITPSLSRCVEIRPTGATKYVLTAEDGKGQSATQSVEVQVQ